MATTTKKSVTVPDIPPVSLLQLPETEEQQRAYALLCSSFYFGLSCLAEGAIPPKVETVIEGARKFAAFIVGELHE